MDILKCISVFGLFLFLSCQKKINYNSPNMIIIEKWEKAMPKKVSIKQYKENTNFSKLEYTDTLFVINTLNYDKEDISLRFHSINEFLPKKDFLLTIDNIDYRLSKIHWQNDTIKAGMGNSWRVIRFADSLNINGKKY